MHLRLRPLLDNGSRVTSQPGQTRPLSADRATSEPDGPFSASLAMWFRRVASALEDYSERGLGFGRWNIRKRLVLLVLTLALPLNVLVIAAIWQLAHAAGETQRTALLYTAQSVAGAVDAHIGKYIGLAQSLANSPALLRDDLRTFAGEAQ